MRGPAVEYIQAISGSVTDGNFGSGTEDAVRRFQRERGLSTDGVVGRETLAAMDALAGGGTKGVERIDLTKPEIAPTLPAPRSVVERGSEMAAAVSEKAIKSSITTPLIAGAMALSIGAVLYSMTGTKR